MTEPHTDPSVSVTVRDLLYRAAVERSLRPSTVTSYERLLRGIGVLDLEPAEARAGLAERLYRVSNVNTRRATVVAARAVLGVTLRIPRAVPRRYDLPDEDTLRLALMMTPYETRCLAMAYAGLRVGEACAVSCSSLVGPDRLLVDRQVQQTYRTGAPTEVAVVPTKAAAADIVVPGWLYDRLAALPAGETAVPSTVRESLRRAGRRVGIALNPHMLRHWYATTLLARGVPLIAVSRQLRHCDPSVTLRTYAQADDAAAVHRALG